METLYFLGTFCLVLFMILATYDGFYLHIFKYKLFNRKDSLFEHKIHALRAMLFPVIVWLLFIENNEVSLVIGAVIVIIDLVVLALDAYSEADSRAFMGGLPKWEYIIHLFANAFHFASIILIIGTKLTVSENKILMNTQLTDSLGRDIFSFVAVNIIPGAIILALIHVLLLFPPGKDTWNRLRKKIVCC
ncbi:MAG: hypothetical protein QNJ57_01715 [Flavobacteriaceae bacterium]|nr:hypothetical protein [Flavobacteriaceae bacterium]